MSTGDRKCLRCGGPMEDGFLWSVDTVGEALIPGERRCGWMAGDDLQRVKKGRGPFAVVVTTNQRRTLTASRCTLCGLVELYAR